MNITDENIEELIFEHLEGNLSLEQSSRLMAFIEENPQYQSELDAWQGSYVRDADPMAAPAFSSLKRKPKTAPLIMAGVTISALVFWGSNTLTDDTAHNPASTSPTEHIVDIKETKPAESTTTLPEATTETDVTVEKVAKEPVTAPEEISESKPEETIDPVAGPVDEAGQRETDLRTSDPREASLQPVPVPKPTPETAPEDDRTQKNKRVKVIELNSEGL